MKSISVKKEELTSIDIKNIRKDLMFFYILIGIIFLSYGYYYINIGFLSFFLFDIFFIVSLIFCIWLLIIEIDIRQGYKYIFEGILVRKDVMQSEKPRRKEYEITLESNNIVKVFDVDEENYYALHINSEIRVYYLKKSKTVIEIKVL
jgi:hypothetical protein